MEKKVFFLRGLSGLELAALYRSARVFVSPFLFEGFGIPIVEALFSGTLDVITREGCFGEAGGPGSIYVDPLNIEEIQAAIAELLQNNQLRQDMSSQGMEYAMRFTDHNIGKTSMGIYESVVKT